MVFLDTALEYVTKGGSIEKNPTAKPIIHNVSSVVIVHTMMKIDMVGSDENEESSTFWTLPESRGDVNSDSEFS